MKPYPFYRIINFVILPFAAFIGVNVLTGIFASIANPSMLLVSFVLFCVPLYAFTANYFYNRSVRLQVHCKASLKDFIKVNAIVSAIFAVLMFFSTLAMAAVLGNPKLLQEIKAKVLATSPVVMTDDTFVQMMKSGVYIFLPFSILLIIHIIYTFRVLHRYRHMFGTPEKTESDN